MSQTISDNELAVVADATLVLAADPQTLGQMRDAMSKAVTGSIVFSMAKGLPNHSAQDIADPLG